MKIRYTFALPLLALSLSGTGQTLDLGNTTPAAGTQFTSYMGDYRSATPGGTGQTWDYSDLQSLGNWTYSIEDAAGNGNSASFPGANMVEQDPDGFSAFYTYSSAGIEFLGLAAPSYNVLMTYQDPQRILVFPCSYNTSWTDDFGGSWSSSTGTPATTTGTLEGTADAVGTLIMPYGTIDNVLRVAITCSYTDNFGGFGSIQYDLVQHVFYKPGVPAPLVQFTRQTSDGMGNYQQDSTSSWLSGDLVGITGAMQHAVGLEVFPNPAVDQATLVFSGTGGAITWEVTDAMGRLVGTGRMPTSPGIMRHSLDLGSYSPGLYHIRLIDTEGNQGIQRLVVE